VSIDREALCESAVQQALRTLLPSTGTASLPPIRDVASS
jgi:hypothetical protein